MGALVRSSWINIDQVRSGAIKFDHVGPFISSLARFDQVWPSWVAQVGSSLVKFSQG